MTIPEKLSALRGLMAERKLSAYLVPTDDFHASEYVGAFFKARAWLSGFTGSAGTLLVLPGDAYLWTDGRYFLQAAAQLEGSGITLMKSGEPGVPVLSAFLAEHLPEGGVLGFDGRTVSHAFVEKLRRAADGKQFSCAGDEDLVGLIWADRPAMSRKPVWELGTEYAGLSRREKLALIRSKLEADALLVTALDDTAWLLNLRGDDIANTPVFLAYLLLTQERATLCVQGEAVSPEIRAALREDGVVLAPYEDIYALLRALPSGSSVQLDADAVNERLYTSVPEGVRIVNAASPIVSPKSVKTPVEQAHMRNAHVKDGVAVTRFIRWLQQTVPSGTVTELSAAARLEQFRAEMEGYLGPSFDPIVAFGAHGAIVHYSPTEETNVTMEPRSFCLADTGGHYCDGTTDITRTIPLGPLTDEEKHAYTLVLKGHLALGAAKFPKGITGVVLDTLARAPLWAEGYDYNHGTGHGVGFLLNVHEGPQRISCNRARALGAPLEAGMITSDEPGLYLTGKFGIRHENLTLCTEAGDTEFGSFLQLEPLTMVPFDRNALDFSVLSDTDLALLNAYHAKVFAAISPYFSGEELDWLRDATAPVTR